MNYAIDVSFSKDFRPCFIHSNLARDFYCLIKRRRKFFKAKSLNEKPTKETFGESFVQSPMAGKPMAMNFRWKTSFQFNWVFFNQSSSKRFHRNSFFSVERNPLSSSFNTFLKSGVLDLRFVTLICILECNLESVFRGPMPVSPNFHFVEWDEKQFLMKNDLKRRSWSTHLFLIK